MTPVPIGSDGDDLVVDAQRVVEATLVEGQPAQPHRAERPALGVGHVGEQGGRLLAALPVADHGRHERHRRRGERGQLGHAEALGEADRLQPGGQRHGERPAVTGDRLGGEHVDQRADRAARAGGRSRGRRAARRTPRVRRRKPSVGATMPTRKVASSAGAVGAADLPVAVEQRLAPRVALDAAAGRPRRCRRGAPARRRRRSRSATASRDRGDDVDDAARVDVALEGVERGGRRQPDVDRLDVAGGLAQQLRRRG